MSRSAVRIRRVAPPLADPLRGSLGRAVALTMAYESPGQEDSVSGGYPAPQVRAGPVGNIVGVRSHELSWPPNCRQGLAFRPRF